MKREYASPMTGIENTLTVSMLCASTGGGVTPPASHDTGIGNGGDPDNAI